MVCFASPAHCSKILADMFATQVIPLPNMSFLEKMSRSFRVALFGIRHASSERNVRIHTIVGVLVVAAGYVYQLEVWEWCAVILAMGLVLSTELINTAIEELSNVVRDQNTLSRGATKLPRDIAAGAVLIAAISSATVGLLIFLPRIFY